MSWQCKCGSTLYYESVRVSGPWIRLMDGLTGETVDTDLGNLKHGPDPRTVSCADCGKKSANPTMAHKKAKS